MLETKFHDQNLTLKISVHENKLLMFHTDFMAQQFPINDIGIELIRYPELVKLGVWHHDGQTYQSLYLIKEDYQVLREFFQKLGFHVHEIPVIALGDDKPEISKRES